MNRKLIFFSIFLSSILVLGKPILAVETEEDNAAEKVTPDSVTKSLKDKLEEVATDKIEKVKSVLGEKASLYAYVGLISNIQDSTITIKAKDGDKKAELSNESTIALSQKGKGEKEIKIKDIKVDYYAIAMGEMKDDGVITVKRLSLSEKPSPVPEKRVVFGKIEEIDEKQVKIKNKEELILDLPTKLNLHILNVKSPKITSVEVEDKVIVVLQEDAGEKEKYTLLAMLVIPGKNSPESKENQLDATASANVASPSAEKE